MPLAIMLILILMSVAATLATGTNADTQDRNQQLAAVVAGQMSWYHMQAVSQCSAPTTCSSGVITVTTPGTGATMKYASSFVSATDGVTVITTWTAGNRFAATNYNLGGMIGNELRKQSYRSLGAGNWSQTSQSVQGNSTYLYSSDGTTGTSSVAVPTTFATLTFTDGAPMLVTTAH